MTRPARGPLALVLEVAAYAGMAILTAGVIGGGYWLASGAFDFLDGFDDMDKTTLLGLLVLPLVPLFVLVPMWKALLAHFGRDLKLVTPMKPVRKDENDGQGD